MVGGRAAGGVGAPGGAGATDAFCLRWWGTRAEGLCLYSTLFSIVRCRRALFFALPLCRTRGIHLLVFLEAIPSQGEIHLLHIHARLYLLSLLSPKAQKRPVGKIR